MAGGAHRVLQLINLLRLTQQLFRLRLLLLSVRDLDGVAVTHRCGSQLPGLLRSLVRLGLGLGLSATLTAGKVQILTSA